MAIRDAYSTVFFAILVVSFVLSAIGPGLCALAVLLVLEPFADVLGAISVDVIANVVGLVLEPPAFVYVAVGVDESSFTVSQVVAPVSLVKRTVLPDLLASAVAFTFFPLPDVHCAVLEL